MTSKSSPGEVREWIENKIKEKKVVVFSKTTCPYCSSAKRLLKEHYVGPEEKGKVPLKQYEVVEIERNPNCSLIQSHLMRMTGGRTVPRVFINGKCIGGSDDTHRLHMNGDLKKKLGGETIKSKEGQNYSK